MERFPEKKETETLWSKLIASVARKQTRYNVSYFVTCSGTLHGHWVNNVSQTFNVTLDLCFCLLVSFLFECFSVYLAHNVAVADVKLNGVIDFIFNSVPR